MNAYTDHFAPDALPEAARHDVATLIEMKRRGEYEECPFYFDATDGRVWLKLAVIEGVNENRATLVLTEGRAWVERIEALAQAEYDMEEK